MFCKNCGRQIYEVSNVCPHCGKNPHPTSNQTAQGKVQKPEGNKNRSVIIVSVVSVLLVVITLVVIAFLFGQKTAEDEDSGSRRKKTTEVVTVIHYEQVVTTEPTTVKELDVKERLNTNVNYIKMRKVDKNTTDVYYGNDKQWERKIALCVAAVNDSVSKGDNFSLTSKEINNQIINNIKTNESYTEFKYNDVQKIQIVGPEIEYNEVVIALSGYYKDTMIFINNGTYVGAYDVAKGKANEKALSDRLYGAVESK